MRVTSRSLLHGSAICPRVYDYICKEYRNIETEVSPSIADFAASSNGKDMKLVGRTATDISMSLIPAATTMFVSINVERFRPSRDREFRLHVTEEIDFR